MESLQEHIRKEEGKLETLRELLGSGKELFVRDSENFGYAGSVGAKDLGIVAKDLSLAERVEIRDWRYMGDEHYDSGQKGNTLHFLFDIETSRGVIKVECVDKQNRYWQDEIGNVQYYFGERTTRRAIPEVCAHYQAKGVKEKVIKELRRKLEELYKTPFP